MNYFFPSLLNRVLGFFDSFRLIVWENDGRRASVDCVSIFFSLLLRCGLRSWISLSRQVQWCCACCCFFDMGKTPRIFASGSGVGRPREKVWMMIFRCCFSGSVITCDHVPALSGVISVTHMEITPVACAWRLVRWGQSGYFGWAWLLCNARGYLLDEDVTPGEVFNFTQGFVSSLFVCVVG